MSTQRGGEVRTGGPKRPLDLNDDNVSLDHDRVRLGHVGTRHQLDRVRMDPRPGWIEVGLAGTDVELPAMPRAAEYLSPAQVAVLPGGARHDEPAQNPLAQRTALMWAHVAQRKEFASDIEDADGSALQRHDSAAARRNLRSGCHDVFQSYGSPYSAMALAR
jgi:hypothetical protein